MKRIWENKGEIAVGTLITIGVFIGGSYLFTLQRESTVNAKIDSHIKEDVSTDKAVEKQFNDVNRKIDALLIKNGIDPMEVLKVK